jgi:UDP-N-acetylglucosamine--N-acetylmuramyl-(pentapeptide) pyrophosphoryl-undecaprenol N-acetylglucosamine transferase
LKTNALPPGWQVLALTGERDYATVFEAARAAAAAAFVARAYLDEIADAYAVADLVLARAGASTLSELAALRKPAILVPYPFATEAHQAANAARFEVAGAALVTTDEELQAGRLPALLAEAMDPARLAALNASARAASDDDPLGRILARVDALLRGSGRS